MVAFTSPTSRSHFFLVHLTVHFKPIKLCNKEYLIQLEKWGKLNLRECLITLGRIWLGCLS